ncbi:MAG: hypothetical protein ABJO27_14085 [Pseudoruegeria sp.]
MTALLLADPTLSALLGDAVHWGIQPEAKNADRYLTLQIADQGEGHHSQGFDGVHRSLVQFDTWGSDTAGALAVRDALRALFKDFLGVRGAVDFRGVFPQGGRMLRPSASVKGAAKRRGYSVDYEFVWKEVNT